MANLDLSKKTILLVDDVEFSRATVARILNGMGYPKVHQAGDGKQALMVLQSNKDIDFVITDFKMPVFNGLQLLKAIRSGKGLVERSLPVALLTSFSDNDLVSMALQLDASAFLVKPVSKGTLNTRLEKMIDLADDTSWLKRERDYEKIKILEESFKDIQDGTFDGRPPEIKKARGSVDTTTAIISDEDGAKVVPDGERVRVSAVHEIPTGSFLAQDIQLKDGRLFLPAGEKLTGRNISLIKDMYELERLDLGFSIVK